MMTHWAEFVAELDAWRAAGRTATFWWRDDDAINNDPAIDRLLTLRRRLGVPLAVAAIPASTDTLFANAVLADTEVWVLQHGYAHHNHAPAGEKKSEFTHGRARSAVCEDLNAGAQLLRDLFGARLLSVLVPPWNRIHEGWIRELSSLGYRGLSLYKPRSARYAAPGLCLVNTHVDIVDWRGRRGYVGLDSALGQVVAHLKQRRHGDVDADEPTGLLTHHLVHDEQCWTFVEEFVARSGAHPAVGWLNAANLFTP